VTDFQARVIVASNRAASGGYADTTGPVLVDGLRQLGATVTEPVVVPDGDPVERALREAVAARVDVVVTTGGTGVSPTDRTPEATARVVDYQIPGIAEAVRAYGVGKVPTAALSRGIAGVAGRTLVVNLAGSRGAVADGLAVLGPILTHAVDQLHGGDHPRPADAATADPSAPDPSAAAGDRSALATPPGGAEQTTVLPATGPRATGPAAAGPGAAGGHSHGAAAPAAGAHAQVMGPGAAGAHGHDAGGGSIGWAAARIAAHAAGAAAPPEPVRLALADATGATLAEPVRARTPLPAFTTASVDGYAVRGTGPWRVSGRVLAGQVAVALADGTAVEIATGAMVPPGADQIIRVEDSTRDADGLVSGQPRRPTPEWRVPGEEAVKGEELLPAGTPVTPGAVGVAAQCGYDDLLVRRPPRATVLVFGDELLTEGLPGRGLVRDSLGPQLPGWLARIGALPTVSAPPAPVGDTLDAHVEAIATAAGAAELVCTTGGTMHGPVDHLHPALAQLGAEYVVDTVAVRPGFPMVLAKLPGGRFVAGLPGNPQSAVIGLLTLVWPLVAGLTGRSVPRLSRVRLGAEIAGRGDDTHLALARLEPDGLAYPLPHNGSAMLRGLAWADGFVLVPPGGTGRVGEPAEFLPFPLSAGERP
jgi:molybdopterin molybdotransferase